MSSFIASPFVYGRLSHQPDYIVNLRSRKALVTTESELKAMAPPVIIGLSRIEHPGCDGDADAVVDEGENRFWRILRMTARLRRKPATMPRLNP